MSRLREFLESKGYFKIKIKEVPLEDVLRHKPTYKEFQKILENAPPPPVSIPDYEAKKKFMDERMFPPNFN